MKNLKEFEALLERYKTITLEEIEKRPDAAYLTGFGSDDTCSLCQAVKVGGVVDCSLCVYAHVDSSLSRLSAPCLKGEQTDSYAAIVQSGTPLDLLIAFRARAAHMRKLLDGWKARK